LEVSPKGTVPVLCIGNQTIDQSLDIMHWALDQSDPEGWTNVDAQIASD
jgi:glutathione S-transferase